MRAQTTRLVDSWYRASWRPQHARTKLSSSAMRMTPLAYVTMEDIFTAEAKKLAQRDCIDYAPSSDMLGCWGRGYHWAYHVEALPTATRSVA